METLEKPHWAETVDVDGLHEPTVRAIIDTMKRTGAGFGARVLEAQYRNDQIEDMDEERSRLLQLVEFIVANPKAPVDIAGRTQWHPMLMYCTDLDELREVRRMIGGHFEKTANESWYQLNGKIGETFVQLYTNRQAACEAVVTGKTTKLVPDPDAKIPMIEIEVDVVEWKCPELLGGEPDSEAQVVTESTDDFPF